VLAGTRINRFHLRHAMEGLNWTEVPELSQENEVVLPPEQQQNKTKSS